MTQKELKELVKQVVAEETEYQQLFKQMLDRSGKDINSMSDVEKKKFFNAVDKAYKAKSEGKLIDSKKKELNEGIIDGILGTIALWSFFGIFLKIAFVKGMKFILKKGYTEIAEKVWKRLIDNDVFINQAVEILKNNKKVTYQTALHLFFNSPEAVKIAKDELKNRRKEFKAKGDVTMLIWEDIIETLADAFSKAWNDSSIQNSVVSKLKTMLKN